MTDFFTRLDRALERLYVWAGGAAAVFLILVGVCVLVSIVSRLLDVYVPGINEYSGYAMAASSFLALAHTLREGGHIRVAIVRSKLTRRAKLWLEVWCLLVASAMSSYLAYYLVYLTWVSYNFEEKSEGAAATLLWKPQAIVAIGSIIFAISMVHGLIRVIVRRDPDAASAAPKELQAE
jgi:TRAP-type mannitol/chloroaromatic compound transport system permease small subunit